MVFSNWAAARLWASAVCLRGGALYLSVGDASENLNRLYFKDVSIYNNIFSYEPVKDKECLDILDCYCMGKIIYFGGMKSVRVSSDLPPTDEIIAMIRRIGKQVQVDQ
jgi:hypothetical protein